MHASLKSRANGLLPSSIAYRSSFLIGSLFWAQSSLAQPDLLDLSLEELLEVEVSSITGRVQNLPESAAAIYVLSSEDIENSSALTIPDLLRMIPGLQVAQIDSNKWAISARGFNSRIASKVLVVIDGRNIYSPTFGTVFWETEDLDLQDIERIEVIRGPGATIWGANAVNGVISITTKSSRATEGTRASITSGNIGNKIVTLQHGGRVGLDTNYRIFGKFREQDEFDTLAGIGVGDSFDTNRLGFRVDSQLTPTDGLMVQGATYQQNIRQNIEPSFDILTSFRDKVDQDGGNLLARWERDTSENATLVTQVYYDVRKLENNILKEEADTFDLDFKWNYSGFENHNIALGAGIRTVEHSYKSQAGLRLDPTTETLKLFNVSIHDDWNISDRAILGLSLKLEDNIYTGLEYQPNVSFNFALTEEQHVWAAATRAVRTPSRAERSVEFTAAILPQAATPGLPADLLLLVEPSLPGMDVEKLESYELGWRFQNSKLNVDLAAFYNKYDSLRSIELGANRCLPNANCFPPIDFIVQPIHLRNADKATTKGLEGLMSYNFNESLDMEVSYSVYDIDYENSAPGLISAPNSLSPERKGPLYKFVAQSNWKMGNSRNLNIAYRHVSDPGLSNPLSNYSVFDARYQQRIGDSITLTLGGRNMFDDHEEFEEDLVNSPTAEIVSMYYLKLDFDW